MDEIIKNQIQNHIKILPCFTCLVRPVCINFLKDGSTSFNRSPCVKCEEWMQRRNYRRTWDWGKIEAEEILKILEEERKNNESCENR